MSILMLWFIWMYWFDRWHVWAGVSILIYLEVMKLIWKEKPYKPEGNNV